MKALLILSDNVYLTPYLRFYTGILEEAGYEYNVFYWDKSGDEFIEDGTYFRFNHHARDKAEKAYGYLKYRKYLMKTIREGNYDLLIPLHSIVLVFLYPVLKKEFRERFIFDIRDYSYERFAFFRKIESDLVNISVMNIVSSKGYLNFLPKAKYFTVHNIPRVDCSLYRQTENTESGVMKLYYIGLIRFMEQNEKIVRFFQGDNRFHLYFVGTNAEQLEDFCKRTGADNVTLLGTFNSSKTLDYYRESDAVLNLYGNHTPLLDYALSNKLYFSASLYKPILVCEDTYMEKVSQEYQIGFTLRMADSSERDELYTYLSGIDRDAFMKKCDQFMAKAIQEDTETRLELLNRIARISERNNRSSKN